MAVTNSQRFSFGKLVDCMDIPNLVELQLESYESFLQNFRTKKKRTRQGLEASFMDCFPIESYDGTCRLEYCGYSLGKPKYSIEECHKRGMTYAAPLKIALRLVRKGASKEQEVYIGELPLMTDTGTFIINGAERVVVSQLHRSPGISLESSLHASGKKVYTVRIIPNRGAWVEFEADINDVLYAYIDRRRKILATTLLRALGISSNEEIISALYEVEAIPELNRASFKKLDGRVLVNEIKNPSTQEVLYPGGTRLAKENMEYMVNHDIKAIKVAVIPGDDPAIVNTLERDPYRTTDDAQVAIYKRIRPGDPPTAESARDLINKLFFDEQRYDLGRVGRFMLSRKLGIEKPKNKMILDTDDVVNVVKTLLKLKNGQVRVDDIDHLGNRRVRSPLSRLICSW